jgi:hypothetical protein
MDERFPVWGNRERRDAARAARARLDAVPRRFPTVEEILHAPAPHDDEGEAA